MAGIERQRRQHRKDLALEVGFAESALLVGQLGVVEQANALIAQLGLNIVEPAAAMLIGQHVDGAADRDQLLGGRRAIGRAADHAGGDLLLDAGHADHKEFIEVGAEDREELDPLQQRVLLVKRLLQHAPVELQPAQLAVEIVRCFCERRAARSDA